MHCACLHYATVTEEAMPPYAQFHQQLPKGMGVRFTLATRQIMAVH